MCLRVECLEQFATPPVYTINRLHVARRLCRPSTGVATYAEVDLVRFLPSDVMAFFEVWSCGDATFSEQTFESESPDLRARRSRLQGRRDHPINNLKQFG